LKNVWQTILPTDLYNCNMGKLLDVLCSDLVRKICALEDISSTLCTSLVDLTKIALDKGPTLFEVTLSEFIFKQTFSYLL
jgi:hypothetical protein